MKISCTQENLQHGLNLVSHLATKNVNLPILSNVLLKAENTGLVLASTNLEMAIRCKVRSKVDIEGVFTVPANLLTNYIGLLNTERIDLEVEGPELKIISENQKTKMRGEGGAEFPIIPEVTREQEYILKKQDLTEGLSQVVFAASLDDTRPEIAGVLFDFTALGLTLAATDSYRLAEKKLNLNKGGKEQKIIIPQASLSELLRVLSAVHEEEIKIYVTENQVLFSVGEVELISRIIEGNYPDYTQIIPKQYKTTIFLHKTEFTKVIKGASLFSKAGINDVNLHFSPEKQEITISAVNNQLGESVMRIAGEITGDSNDIVFNYRYLLDGLSNLSGEEIKLEILDNSNPGLFRARQGEDYLYIIMPIRQ